MDTFINNFSPRFTELNICFAFYTNISAFILIIVILSFNYLASSMEYQKKTCIKAVTLFHNEGLSW